jgi:hypothetical protein
LSASMTGVSATTPLSVSDFVMSFFSFIYLVSYHSVQRIKTILDPRG